jgi:mRNA-degrading endonuclease toxin of MazEF toxin-antitoxin module
MADQITTVSKVRVINIMGRLSQSDLSAVELAVKIQLLL